MEGKKGVGVVMLRLFDDEIGSDADAHMRGHEFLMRRRRRSGSIGYY